MLRLGLPMAGFVVPFVVILVPVPSPAKPEMFPHLTRFERRSF
jgi:hypothetical protein